MKALFQSYIPDSEEEIKRAWKDAIIVFDANMILNLYRYSDKSRSEFIDLLRDLKNRIWAPEQAVYEYFNNRTTVIGDQTKAYEAAKKSIVDLRDSLHKDRGQPFIGEKTMDNLKSILQKVEGELEANKNQLVLRITSDDIRTDIVDVFDGRVGERLSKDEYEELFAEGVKRYEQKTPPGYKDGAKRDNPTTFEDKRSVFGDVIVWKQTIAKAKELKKPVIFVTDDAKEDWWLEAQGKTIGPRPELLSEFFEHVGEKFFMYRPDQFLKHAKDELKSEISTETIDEIRATDEVRLTESARNKLLSEFSTRSAREKYRSKLSGIVDALDLQTDKYDVLVNKRNLNRLVVAQDRNWANLLSYETERAAVERGIEETRKELDHLTSRWSEIQNQDDFDNDEMMFIMRRRSELKSDLIRKQSELLELKEKIALWAAESRNRTLDDDS